MTFFLNKVMLAGRLGADPEIVDAGGRGRIAKLSVATQESWRDKTTGDWTNRTHWHRVAVYPAPLVKLCEDRLTKGDTIYVEGQLDQRKWQKDGATRYATEVAIKPYVGSLTILPSRKQPSSDEGEHDD